MADERTPPCPWCGDGRGSCEERTRDQAHSASASHDMTRAAIILACAIRAAFIKDGADHV